MMICFFAHAGALNVWKNSSCVLSFPMINWISSISRTSILRYFSRNFVIAVLLPFRIASISSFVKVHSLHKVLWSVDYFPDKVCDRVHQMGFPKSNTSVEEERVVDFARRFGNCKDAACANLLLLPTTKFSKVYSGFKFAFSNILLKELSVFEEESASFTTFCSTVYTILVQSVL